MHLTAPANLKSKLNLLKRSIQNVKSAETTKKSKYI